MSDQHDDASGAVAEKQPIRSRRRNLRLLRFHPRLEQVPGAGSLPPVSGTRSILPGPVAPIHPRHTIPSRPRNAHHAVLIRHLISGLTHPFTTEELIKEDMTQEKQPKTMRRVWETVRQSTTQDTTQEKQPKTMRRGTEPHSRASTGDTTQEKRHKTMRRGFRTNIYGHKRWGHCFKINF